MTTDTQLDYFYRWESTRRDDVWLTQPMGGGEVCDLTFGRCADEVRRMAAHLGSLDLPPASHIAIFAKNNAWWFLADLAIWMAGHVSIPLYPTLGPTTIREILEHSEAKLIFIGKLDGFSGMEPGIPADLPRIALPLSPAMNAPRWADIVGKTAPLTESPRRNPDDLATIVYTSGSTGKPKGVMHSFRTMTESRRITNMYGVTNDDRMLSYLPLAHVAERFVVETPAITTGLHVYFAESLDTFVTDLKRARPTMFLSVPRLWVKFQAGVFSKMPPAKIERYLKIPILRGIVKKKILAGLGLDSVRVAGSGSAPIPADVLNWYRRLGLELLEGYGMSENFAFSHTTRPGEVRVGYVGRPYDGVEQRISEEGEVQVKSPATMIGYYKAPELTAEMITADGFLRTGDRGELDEIGRLKITGRVKELFKTSKGKYVAPAPIENLIMADSNIEQACVSGQGQGQPFAMVVLSPSGKSGPKSEVERSIEALIASINPQLDPHEHLQCIVVIGEDWSVENGMLTPTMKLKRSAIEARYANDVDGWYGAKRKIVWAAASTTTAAAAE